MKQHRGVVVLSTSNDLTVEAIGWTLLQRLPLTSDSTHAFARELVGIGTALELDQPTQSIRITKVFGDSPAGKAGLTSGMIIQRINDTATQGKSLAECMTLLRGGVGTKVRLELLDVSGKTTRVDLTRAKFSTATG
jgi:carboxyl-terminal processing protease